MSQVESVNDVNSVEDLDIIVDADGHLHESFHEFLHYADDRFSAEKELMEVTPVPLSQVYSVASASPSYVYDQKKGNTLIEADTETGEILDLLDELGITKSVVSPTTNLLLPTVNNSKFAVALANGYNNWVLDVLEDQERLKANILVAPHKPQKAAEEINRLADEDLFVGVQLPATGIVPPAGHERYDPIYESAETHNLPIAMHSATGASGFPQQNHWNETYAEDHTVQHPFSHMWNLTTMVFRGVPEKFPDLEFVLQESGIGYVPYMMTRLDDHYMELGYEIPLLEKLPSKYIKDQFYFGTQPIGHSYGGVNYAANMIELIGADSIMFAGDTPHPDFDTPEELFNRIKNDFD